jgi:hypothetical protein
MSGMSEESSAHDVMKSNRESEQWLSGELDTPKLETEIPFQRSSSRRRTVFLA